MIGKKLPFKKGTLQKIHYYLLSVLRYIERKISMSVDVKFQSITTTTIEVKPDTGNSTQLANTETVDAYEVQLKVTLDCENEFIFTHHVPRTITYEGAIQSAHTALLNLSSELQKRLNKPI